jgi:hypothetical protein
MRTNTQRVALNSFGLNVVDARFTSRYDAKVASMESSQLKSTPSRRRFFKTDVNNQPLVTYALDGRRRVWILSINHSGDATLLRDDVVVMASLSQKQGCAILNGEGSPFERAESFVSTLRSKLSPDMSEPTRLEFEFDVARWIPEYFDL